MGEDGSGTSNLIAFPRRSADGAPADSAPSETVPETLPEFPRDRDLIRRLETIARTIGVPVATFLGAARERAAVGEPGAGGDAEQSETAELLRLFGRISDGQTRDQCLSLLRMLAASEPEAGRSR